MVRESHDKANLLDHYFHRIFTSEDLVLPTPPPAFTGLSLDTIDVSSRAVRDKPLKFKPDSSPGPSELHPMILREMATVMTEYWA